MPTKNNNSYLENKKSVPAETSNIQKKGSWNEMELPRHQGTPSQPDLGRPICA